MTAHLLARSLWACANTAGAAFVLAAGAALRTLGYPRWAILVGAAVAVALVVPNLVVAWKLRQATRPVARDAS